MPGNAATTHLVERAWDLTALTHNYDKHDLVPCQLCGQTFVCLCNRAADCPCAQVNLTRDEAEWIGWQTGGDCVCMGCLVRLRSQARLAMPEM